MRLGIGGRSSFLRLQACCRGLAGSWTLPALSFNAGTVPVALGLLGPGLMGFRLSSSGFGSITGRPSLPGRVGSSTATTVMTPIASGLDLPAPALDVDYHFDGLHAVLRMGLRSTDRAAMGGGNSCWFFNANGDFPDDHPRWHCLCGRAQPSRVHLLWSCECTEHLRTALRPPTDRCEERLLLQGVPEQPAPLAIDFGDFHDDLVQALTLQLRQEPAVLLLATDVSEYCDVGSYAAAVHPGGFTCADYDLANYLLLLLPRLLETSYTGSSLCCACCWLANASGCCWLGERFGLLLAALSSAAVCWALTCELSLRLLLSFLTPRFTRDV